MPLMSDITLQFRKAFLQTLLMHCLIFNWFQMAFLCILSLSKHFFFLLWLHSLLFPCPSPDRQVEDFLLWIRPRRLASAVCWCNCLKQILWTFPLRYFFPSVSPLFMIIIINFALSTIVPRSFGVINMLVTFHSNEFECNDTWISIGVTVFFPFLNYIKDVIYVQIIKCKKMHSFCLETTKEIHHRASKWVCGSLFEGKRMCLYCRKNKHQSQSKVLISSHMTLFIRARFTLKYNLALTTLYHWRLSVIQLVV